RGRGRGAPPPPAGRARAAGGGRSPSRSLALRPRGEVGFTSVASEETKTDAVDSRELAEEQRRADALRRTVDVACALLRQARLPRDEAEDVVAFTRERVLQLFPGKEDAFDLILAPRFARILDEFCPPRRPRVLPFARR